MLKELNSLVGRKIVAVNTIQWGCGIAPLLHLDDGTLIIVSSDEEGNDAGTLVWQNPNKNLEGIFVSELPPSYPKKK